MNAKLRSEAKAAFSPPAYPYEKLNTLRALASELPGGVVDLSVGTPTDPPSSAVIEAIGGVDIDSDGMLRGYPPSAGTLAARRAAADWMGRKFGVAVPAESVALCVGTKEFVATLPQWLHLRQPDKDVVLYPSVAYPTYEMGALLAGLCPYPVPVDAEFRLDLGQIPQDVAERALVLWVNSPGNPAGQLEDLRRVSSWCLERGILPVSDECYSELTWKGPAQTILGHGTGESGLGGVLALHSLSKRSNLAGLRFGWYAGDPELVTYLKSVRQHAGFMVPGPVQRAAVVALGDDAQAAEQAKRYASRLERAAEILSALGAEVEMPEGGIYLWVPAPAGDAWAFTEELAKRGGAIVSPGEFYGEAGAGRIRLAVVRPLEQLDLVAKRLGI